MSNHGYDLTDLAYLHKGAVTQ